MTKSKIIYEGTHYTACAMRDGSLIVTKNDMGGKRVIGEQAKEFIEAIETAICPQEAHALCRSVINS